MANWKDMKRDEGSYILNGNVCIFGTSGVGKSTLLNCFLYSWIQDNSCPFKSNVTFFSSPSLEVSTYILKNGMLLIDTPGFDEPETHVKVSQCILDSLKLRNNMKIMFVVELDAGNVRSSNAALIQAILQETKIDPSNCGIIINKLGKTMKRRLLGEEGMISKILSRLFGKTTETSNILLVQRYEELDDVDHAITKIPDLVPFIQALPSVQIPTNLTDPISLSISLEKRRDMIEGNVLINDDPEKGKENDKIPVTASAPNFEQRNGEKKHQYLTAPYSNIKTKSKKENKKHIKKLRNTDEAIDGLKPTTNEKTGMCKSEKKKTSQL